MRDRSGPFWDAMQGREPLPRAAATLGMEFVDVDVGAGTIGPALLATLAPDQFQSTLQLSVSFLRPVRPGRLVGRGRVVHRDGELVYLEASLADPEGVVVATATAIARVIGLRDASAAA